MMVGIDDYAPYTFRMSIEHYTNELSPSVQINLQPRGLTKNKKKFHIYSGTLI